MNLKRDLYIRDLDLDHVDRNGLFGKKLSLDALIMLTDKQPTFDFKPTYSDYRKYRDWFQHDFNLYDYRNDKDYYAAIRYVDSATKGKRGDHNISYLAELDRVGLTLLPIMFTINVDIPMVAAHRPEDNEGINYMYPSYIIWKNDPSYISFLGSPEGLEVLKDVLRQTTGHPEQRSKQVRLSIHRSSGKWDAIPMSSMAGGNKRVW